MTSSLSDQDIERKIADAQSHCLDLERCTTPPIATFVSDYAASIGCPKEFFLVPLQPITAHFMGPKTSAVACLAWG